MPAYAGMTSKATGMTSKATGMTYRRLFLLRFCGGQFRQHRIYKLRQKFAVFNLVVSHAEATFKQLSIELLQNMVTKLL